MGEGRKILEGREVESYTASGSRWKVKGKDEKREGRDEGISKLRKDVRKVAKMKRETERREMGKLGRIYLIGGKRAIFERSDKKGNKRDEREAQ